MPPLIKNTFKKGDPVAAVGHDWHNMVATVLNDITGVGCAVEKTAHGWGWKIVVDNSQFEETAISGHRFKPTLDSTGTNVNISEGSWTGYDDTATVTSTGLNLGDSTNVYIVASVDTAVAPTTLTIGDTDVLPADSDHQTKRLICTLTYDTVGNGTITGIDKAQVGDIHTERQIDKNSLNYTDSADLQLANFATATDLGTTDTDDLFPMKDGTDSTLKYVSLSTLSGGVVGGLDTTSQDYFDLIDDVVDGINDSVGTTPLNHGALTQRDQDTNSHDQLYILMDSAAGTATRNSMGGVIGDTDNVVSIAPSTRVLSDTAGAAAVSYGGRTLDGGVWTVTDTTAADSTGGALNIDGGARISLGMHVNADGTASAGSFENANDKRAELANDAWAGAWTDSVNEVQVCDGTRAVNVTTGDYYHSNTQGISKSVFAQDSTGTARQVTISGGIITRWDT